MKNRFRNLKLVSNREIRNDAIIKFLECIYFCYCLLDTEVYHPNTSTSVHATKGIYDTRVDNG